MCVRADVECKARRDCLHIPFFMFATALIAVFVEVPQLHAVTFGQRAIGDEGDGGIQRRLALTPLLSVRDVRGHNFALATLVIFPSVAGSEKLRCAAALHVDARVVRLEDVVLCTRLVERVTRFGRAEPDTKLHWKGVQLVS